MKKPILIIREDEGTVENVMSIVSRLRNYQEKKTKTPREVIKFYETIREQLYFNKALEKPVIHLLCDFVNSEITRAMYKELEVKPLDKFVLRINPLFNPQQLSRILYLNFYKEKWIECDEGAFRRMFIESDEELYPIQFLKSINNLIQVFRGLCEERTFKDKKYRIIQEEYKALIVDYFINDKGEPYKLGSIKSLNTRYTAKPDSHTKDVVDSILRQVFATL